METESWPFDQPRNCAVFTTREVMEREEPILLVSHDVEDHAWQFIGPTDGTLENARIIALQEAVELDPSLLELSDLPVGWQAVRQSRGDVWARQRCPN
jgi:hypothetical protein